MFFVIIRNQLKANVLMECESKHAALENFGAQVILWPLFIILYKRNETLKIAV